MNIRVIPFAHYFDNEEVPESETPEPETLTPETPKSDTKFSQEDVNRFLADERRKLQKQNERTIKQLDELKKSTQLTSEEKEKLETRIEDLKNEFLTKEELSKKEVKRESEKSKRELETYQKEAEKWRSLFATKTIERDILDAAGSDAYNNRQILQILKPDARLVEELGEDGQPTGGHVTRIKYAGKDKDGNPIPLDLTVTEAIKQMKEDADQFGNLFRSGANGGLGGNNSNVNRNTNGPPSEPAAFRRWLKDNPQFLGRPNA